MNEETTFYINIEGEAKKLKLNEALERCLLIAYEDQLLLKDDLFVIPTVNFAMSLIDSIEICYFERKYVPCSILMRSLLDATMSMIYFLQVPQSDYDSFFEEYFNTGELTQEPNKKGKRRRVSGQKLCEVFKNTVNYDVSAEYRNLSKYVHSTIKHFHAIYKDCGDRKFEFPLLGEETKFPEENYKELPNLLYMCVDVIILILLQRNNIRTNKKINVR